jgi:peptide/nickel transport system permease protein
MKKIAGYFIKALALIMVVISINFALINFMPGDPIVLILGEQEYFRLLSSHPEVLNEVIAQYDLDKPLILQYFTFLKNTLTFQFGKSFIDGQNTIDLVLFRMQWTLLLAFSSIIISALIGGALGVLAGYYKGSKLDGVMTFVFLFLETIPANCLALIVLLIFGFQLRWFPIGGMASGGLRGFAQILDIAYHMTLPVAVLSVFRTSTNFLMVKSFVSQIREEEYIITATAKGIPKNVLLRRHILTSILVPYATILCIQFGFIFSGSMLIEIVFSWRGMGMLIYRAVMTRDYPTIQLCFLVTSTCVILFHFIGEVLAWKLDPRIKDGVTNEP